VSYKEQCYKWSEFVDTSTRQIVPFAQSADYAMRTLGIPRKYAKVIISKIEPKTQEQVTLINALWQMANEKSPRKALICNGVNHCGKTHIACGMINYLDFCDMAINGNLAKNGPSNYHPKYVAEADFLDRITSFRSTTNFFDLYTDDCKFLVLDEFGSTKWTATEARKVNQVLNKRFNNNYQTVLLTNRAMNEVFELMGDDVRSRFYGCHSITMKEAVQYESYTDKGQAENETDVWWE
jgi:DNA replication protein DnaC